MIATLLLFIAVLGVLVLVHEIGHFITARFFGVAVEEFGVGFPPRLFGFRRKKTLYSVNAVPLGGFVRIKGESGDHAEDTDSFSSVPSWQRLVILLAGVMMNFFLAFILLTVGFMIGMPQEIDDTVPAGSVRDERILVLEVEDGSPADEAGLRPGDTLVSINGTTFHSPDDVVEFIRSHSGETLSLSVQRGSDISTIEARPAQYSTHERPLLGIATIRSGIISYPFLESIYRGAAATFVLTVAVLGAFGALIYGLFSGGGLAGNVSGPIGVAVLTNQVAQLGIPYLINFTAMLSVNLGILNAIPFPALDGGRALFVFLGKAKGRPISPKVEAVFHNVGFLMLILLVVFITYHDIVQYGQQILQGIKSIVS